MSVAPSAEAAPDATAPAAGVARQAPRPEAGLSIDVVIPTVGRASLTPLLERLVSDPPCAGGSTIVVDDRPAPAAPLTVPSGVVVLRSGGRGPAAARNVGWRAATSGWVVFVDDDVLPDPGWAAALRADLWALGGDRAPGVTERAAGTGAASRATGVVSQGRLRVPLPPGRAATDAERNVARLGSARWITADLAVPRRVLALSGGFDERFPRAYREDTDLALRLTAAGVDHTWGGRTVAHPVAATPWWVSVTRQRGNADDARLRSLHGRGWRAQAGVPRGRFRRHAAIVGCATLGVVAACTGRSRLATVGALGWSVGTAELTCARCRPGPPGVGDAAAMAATSVVLPFTALGWRAGGALRERCRRSLPPLAVLFDRDGTLVEDVPYNGDPTRVRLRAGARQAVERARHHGLAVGLVTNQSGIARRLISRAAVDAVNAEVGRLVGGFDVVVVCPHGAGDGCGCRKPAPGMVRTAAAALGAPPERCWVVGDIGADVAAAHAAGARGVLVPTPVTQPDEVRLARIVAPDLGAAMDVVLGRRARGRR